MRVVYFISHPEVEIDPSKPVPLWGLSAKGRARMQGFAEERGLPFASIWSSGEMKAVEAATILAKRLQIKVKIERELHENDRSATGFLPPSEFEQVADAFFATPDHSFRGWERAIDAQARVALAVDRILAAAPEGDIAIVAHGGVGTLLLCQYLGIPISRAVDQPHQGHYWAFERGSRHVLTRWMSIGK